MVKTRAQVEEDNQLSPYRTTQKLKLAISSAQSHKFNPRNHENNWHPVWGHVMHELLTPYDNLIPYVQYAQWRSEDGVLPEMSHRQAATADNAGDLNAQEDTDESASQTDTDSSESPIPINLKEMSKRGTANFSKDKVKVRNAKRFGLQTVHLCPALLGEMKANVSRHKEIENLANQRVEENEKPIRRLLFDAIEQMGGYLGTFFKRYPNIHEIVALVTVGPYWQYKLYQKEAFFVFWDEEKMKFQGDVFVMRHKRTAFAASFGQNFYELGTEESDEALTQMRDRYLDHLSKE
ncbi:hypothetical protein C8R41DRAFT_964005 [Lentinula lateritia]|uniref:Uncharacterized protein n=1 Tax=Lentinula lateritia TaxID=40482 RepID=A0ABQ8VUQ4_9AGAR|nr:hypothetical protein C8R41DRAFT_964005 [Lentinula lateritia]